MIESVHFKGGDFEYSVRFIDGSLELDWYHPGSMYGGTGTEGGNTVGIKDIPTLLASMKIATLDELRTELLTYKDEDWSRFHDEVKEFRTGTWVWSDS